MVCESLYTAIARCSLDQPEFANTLMDLKRRWGMDGTKPIESEVKAMPRRSDVESMLSAAIGTDSFDTN